ncbi:Malonamoyl-CoA synthetase vrtB [Bienertia sinuspersici]
MISVDRSVYDEYCKSHPNCKNLYAIPFPHLHTMMEIYGKDYATGKPAETFQDVVGTLENPKKEKEVQVDKVKTEKKCKNKEPRKVRPKSTNSELACLQDFMKDMNSHLSTMASVWSRADDREQDMADKSSLK